MKAFLRDQCKEKEENNRMGNTRELFKKNRDNKGIFHAKMGSIKDRNGMDLTEAEDIKKWQEYAEEHDPREGWSSLGYRCSLHTVMKGYRTSLVVQ